MERLIKLIPLLSLMVFASCNKEAELPVLSYYEDFTEIEMQLMGTWKYQEVVIKGIPFVFADKLMEPGVVKASLGGARAEIERRMIRYSPEKTYQLQWIDRGNYELGTEGEENWQPGFGYWTLNESGDTLIHNSGQPSETLYKISFKDNVFTRESIRKMNSFLQLEGNFVWKVNEEVLFKEIFIRVE